MRPSEKIAFIREADCIGCALCIRACPVDCIIGAFKFMHTVIARECIGCELCLPVCPTDCIEMPARTASQFVSHAKMKSISKRRAKLKRARMQDACQKNYQPTTARDELKEEIERAVARKRGLV